MIAKKYFHQTSGFFATLISFWVLLLSLQLRAQGFDPAIPRMVGNIPVYEEFAGLKPIFEQKTDTTYIINFWATWCTPCVEELPYFEQLHDDFAGEKVKVILVSLDFPKKLESKLLPFVTERRLRSQVVALTDIRFNDWIDQVDPQWGGAIPVTVLYKGDQRKFVDDQFDSYEELKELVISLL